MGKREEAAMALLVEMPPGTVMSKEDGLRYVDAVIACFPEVVQQEKRRLRRELYFKKLGAVSVSEGK